MDPTIRQQLQAGVAIPAHPLALNANRKLDERRQRALSRYYIAAGAGGLAVGVHTTQFAIRRSDIGLYRPVLEIAAETIADAVVRAVERDRAEEWRPRWLRIAPTLRALAPGAFRRLAVRFGRQAGAV